MSQEYNERRSRLYYHILLVYEYIPEQSFAFRLSRTPRRHEAIYGVLGKLKAENATTTLYHGYAYEWYPDSPVYPASIAQAMYVGVN